MSTTELPLFFILNDDDRRRFMARTVEAETSYKDVSCLSFTGYADRDGYYKFWINELERNVGAHRVAYLDHHGSIPDGYVIDHLCRNRGCVRVEHLDATPPSANYERGNRPRTSPLFVPKTHCKWGHPRSGDNLGGPTPSGQYYCKACLATRNAKNNAKRGDRRAQLREGKV